VGIDFQGPFPASHRYRNCYVLVIVDHCTRYLEAWPVKAADSRCAIEILETHLCYRHSVAKEILVDQGSCFSSASFRDFCSKYNIRRLQTTAYNPNTNGICERTNVTIKRIVKKYVNKGHKDWDQFISKAVFSINTTVHTVTKFSSFFLVFNRQPNLRADNLLPSNNEFADENPVDLNSI